MTTPTNDPKPSPLEYERPDALHKVLPGLSRRQTVMLFSFAGLVFLMLLVSLLPERRPREPSMRVRCASNMRQIGLATILYASEHGGLFPDDLQTTFECGDLGPAVFNCPSTSDTPATGPTTQATAIALMKPGHLSYIYVGRGLKSDAPADVVILFEPLADHANDGMNVLFIDGHVEWLSSEEAQPIITQARAGIRPIRYPAATQPATEK